MNNQDDLHDDVDSRLQHLYRQLPKEQPSAELDANILAAAHAAQKKPYRWQAPFALAASVVMVSSLVLYLRQDNTAVFNKAVSIQTPTVTASAPSPAPKMDAVPVESAPAVVSAPSIAKQLAEKKDSSSRQKDQRIAESTPQMASEDAAVAFAENKVAAISRNDQLAKAKSAPLAKEQEARVAVVATDKLEAAAAPAPQVQSQSEPTELDDLKSGGSGQIGATAAALAAKPSAAPAIADTPAMNAGAMAGSAMPMANQRAKRDEAKANADAEQTMSMPMLNVEGVAMGMSREQLLAQGLTCYVDVCHLDVKQPQQDSYWGMPALNVHLTAFLSRNAVTKLVLQQKHVPLESVKTVLSTVGVESQQSCIEEKGGLLLSRQSGEYIFNVRSTGSGLSMAICQYGKSQPRP